MKLCGLSVWLSAIVFVWPLNSNNQCNGIKSNIKICTCRLEAQNITSDEWLSYALSYFRSHRIIELSFWVQFNNDPSPKSMLHMFSAYNKQLHIPLESYLKS